MPNPQYSTIILGAYAIISFTLRLSQERACECELPLGLMVIFFVPLMYSALSDSRQDASFVLCAVLLVVFQKIKAISSVVSVQSDGQER